MHITRLSVDQAFAGLHSAREGLASAEAARRLAEYGPNCVEEIAREPLWLKAARQFTHFFALILAIVYAAPGNAAFGTAPIAPEVWLFMLPFAAAMLVLEEGRKWWVRRC